MSALGTTIDPSGEHGTIDGVVGPLPDVKPDNPRTIGATTSVETLNQVLYNNWIWRNTFTIDTTMKPGHIIGSIKIHPKNFHQYLTHVSNMFLTWTGSGKVRMRFMATFQFGGSFRVGFLPPHFTEQQVNNMPIDTLTAYPNRDLDPKNTEWTEFQAPDERNVLFHYMRDLTDEDPSSFGGWIVFYVAAPLVVSGEMSQISMLVEAAGGFEFAQLSPLTSVTPTNQGWLSPSATLDLLRQQGCDDRYSDEGNAIQIHANTIKQVNTGFFLSRSTRKGDATPLVEGGSLGSAANWTRLAILTNNSHKIVPTCFTNAYVNEGGLTRVTPFVPVFDDHVLPHNTEEDAFYWGGFYDQDIAYAQDIVARRSEKKEWVPNRPTKLFRSTRPDHLIADSDLVFQGASGVLAGNLNMPINVAKTGIIGDTSILTNSLPNESIVSFVNTNIRSLNVQTRAMSDDLAKVSSFSPNTSQLYELRATDASGPIMLLRLHPSGMFTTNAVSSDTLITRPTGQLYLRYLQDLPMSSALPVTVKMLDNIRAAQKITSKGHKSDDYWRINFWQRM